MKIGILTQPLGPNYGGILQNWALHHVLTSIGHTPVTIKHYGISNAQKFITDTRCVAAWLIKNIIRHKTRNVYVLPWHRQRHQNNRLKQFVKKHIRMTPLLTPLTERAIVRCGFDAIVVGSDQTWRPLNNGGHLSEMFCSFLSEYSNVSRIAYAASFGVDCWEYNEYQTEMARKGASKFQAISVREGSGVRLCKSFLNVDANHVLDPTFLVEPAVYNKLISDKELNKIPSSHIGVYILDETEDKRELVESVCQMLGKEANWFGRKDKNGKYHSVEHWLASFEKSDFIITDSFHGTAFSINYHRPFITILNPERGADRFTSLLGLLGLENRAIEPSDIQMASSVISENINWGSVDVILLQERIKSLKFLNENIK